MRKARSERFGECRMRITEPRKASSEQRGGEGSLPSYLFIPRCAVGNLTFRPRSALVRNRNAPARFVAAVLPFPSSILSPIILRFGFQTLEAIRCKDCIRYARIQNSQMLFHFEFSYASSSTRTLTERGRGDVSKSVGGTREESERDEEDRAATAASP